MAIATLILYLTDIDLLDTTTPTTFGSRADVAVNITDLKIQGAGCAGCGMTTGNGAASIAWANMDGCYVSGLTGVSGTGHHLHAWIRTVYPVYEKVNVGIGLLVGSTTGDMGIWAIAGFDTNYGGEWLHVVLNIDGGASADVATGTPNLASVAVVGIGINMTVSLGENMIYNTFFDAIRVTDASDRNGIACHGGLTGDRLLLTDVANADTKSHGTSSAGTAYGILTALGAGVFRLDGELYVGASGFTTYLDDKSITIFCADLPVSSTYYNVIYQTGGANDTLAILTGLSLSGVSRSVPVGFDGSALTSTETGSIDGSSITFGRTVKFGAYCSGDNVTFNETVTIEPAGRILNNPSFKNCDRLTLTATNDGISGGATTLHNATTSFVLTDDLSKITNLHAFDNTGGTGHAVELNSLGSGTMSWNATDTGYAGTNGVTGDETIYVNVASGTLTINVGSGASTPTIRTAGATISVVASYTLTLTGMPLGSEITITELTGNVVDGVPATEVHHVESITASGTTAYAYSTSGVIVDIIIQHVDYDINLMSIYNYTLSSIDASIPITVVADTNYNNP